MAGGYDGGLKDWVCFAFRGRAGISRSDWEDGCEDENEEAVEWSSAVDYDLPVLSFAAASSKLVGFVDRCSTRSE
jgi:hypothetical protein